MSRSVSKKTAAILALVVLVTVSGCSPLTDNLPAQKAPTATGTGYIRQLDCLYFEAGDFLTHTAKAKAYGAKTLSAGVVPHHLLAGELIASFFKTAGETGERYDTVILLGPNHKGEGSAVSTTRCSWKTEFGTVKCDEDVVSEIMACKTLVARINDDILQNDHAVSSLVPYIKYYLPDIKVVTVLLTRQVTLEQSKDIALLLNSIAQNKKCLVVGSVDFSHGLTTQEAKIRDEGTRQAIFNNDHTRIKRMPNENLDSPETLCAILYYMQERGAYRATLFGHKSAADYLENPILQDCTTYFVLGSP
jgi:AmmeMemoRadiSam system protein B